MVKAAVEVKGIVVVGIVSTVVVDCTGPDPTRVLLAIPPNLLIAVMEG